MFGFLSDKILNFSIAVLLINALVKRYQVNESACLDCKIPLTQDKILNLSIAVLLINASLKRHQAGIDVNESADLSLLEVGYCHQCHLITMSAVPTPNLTVC